MGKVWAVAKNLILEFLRLRILASFVILSTLTYTVGFACWLHSDTGLVYEKTQTFLSYSLSCAVSFLTLLTIFVSIASITRDIKRKEIFTVATKPITRGQFLSGKFLGLALLNLILLVFNGVLIYAMTHTFAYSKTANDDDRARLKELVLIARRSVKPELPDISAEVEQKVKTLLQQKVREDNVTDPAFIKLMRRVLTKNVTNQLQLELGSVPPGSTISWHFKDIQPMVQKDGLVYIRYKQDVSINPPDLATDGQWLYGPEDPVKFGGKFRFSRDPIRTVREFAVPVTELSPAGDLYLAYRNSLSNDPVTVIYPADTGIEVLYVVAGFEENLCRTLGMIYLRLLFVSALGLALGAWLSLPVAVLLVLVIYIMGISSGFLLEAVSSEATETKAALLQLVLFFMPSYSAYDPVHLIEKGRLVSWPILENIKLALSSLEKQETVASSVWKNLLLLKDFFMTGLVALFGYLIFRFRELARVIV